MSIKDNGIGFDIQAAQDSAGLCAGMRSMAARVQRIGGTFQVQSSPTTETLIHIELPLNSHTASLARHAARNQLIAYSDKHPLRPSSHPVAKLAAASVG